MKNSEVVLEAGDRVAVSVEGKVLKARVVTTDGQTVGVTTEKGGEVISFPRANVLPLYRGVGGAGGFIGTLANDPKFDVNAAKQYIENADI